MWKALSRLFSRGRSSRASPPAIRASPSPCAYAPPRNRFAILAEYDRDVPGDLKVKGDLVLQYRPRLRSLGDGLTVRGHLIVGGGYGRFESSHEREKRRVPIRALPRRLSVTGDV